MVRHSMQNDETSLTLRHALNRSEWNSIRRVRCGPDAFEVLTFGPRLKTGAHQGWELFAVGESFCPQHTILRIHHPQGR